MVAQLENPLRLQRVEGTDRFGLRLVDNDGGRIDLNGHQHDEYGPTPARGQERCRNVTNDDPWRQPIRRRP